MDDRSEQDVDILRSEKEDLQERVCVLRCSFSGFECWNNNYRTTFFFLEKLEASLVEIKNLSDGKDELVSFVYSLQEKYNQAEEILR